MVGYKNAIFETYLNFFQISWFIPEARQGIGEGGVEDIEFPGVLRRKTMSAHGNSRGQLRKKLNFQKSCVISIWVLVFDPEISKGCNAILQNFQ